MDQDGRYAAMDLEGNPTLASLLPSLDDDINLPEGVAAIAFPNPGWRAVLPDIGIEAVLKVKRNFHLMTDATEEFKALKRAKGEAEEIAKKKAAETTDLQNRMDEMSRTLDELRADLHAETTKAIRRADAAETQAAGARAEAAQAIARADAAETQAAQARAEAAQARTEAAQARTERKQAMTEAEEARTEAKQAIVRAEAAEAKASEALAVAKFVAKLS